MILAGQVEPLQIGAFLMLLRVKEETPEELAGFVQVSREFMSTAHGGLSCDIDWSSYAGKRHQHPWFILAILLLSTAGYRVLVHGSAGHTLDRLHTEEAMLQLGLPVASGWDEVEHQLHQERLSYVSLTSLCPPLAALLNLRPLLGLRSPVNTLARMLNPLRSTVSIQSVFHPAYARLHQGADQLLGQPRAMVFKGEGGEVEVKPQSNARLHLLDNEQSREIVMPRSFTQQVSVVKQPSVGPLRALWRGEVSDDYGLAAVLATTATALIAVTPGLTVEDARERALKIWQSRDQSRLR